MGLTRQLSETLEQLIDDTIHQTKRLTLHWELVGEIRGGFYNYFTVVSKRPTNDEELVEMYHVVRGRASEIRNAILAVE